MKTFKILGCHIGISKRLHMGKHSLYPTWGKLEFFALSTHNITIYTPFAFIHIVRPVNKKKGH